MTSDAGDDGGPARKRARVRVSTACVECRKRKEKCDGTLPKCRRCDRAGRGCSYREGRKRGLPTGYVRGLEILLGLLIHAFDEAESLVKSILNGHNGSSCGTGTDHAAFAPSTESLLTVWRASSASGGLQEHLQSLHSGEDEEQYLQTLNDTLTQNYNRLVENAPRTTEEHPAVAAAPTPGEAFSFDDAPVGETTTLTAEETYAPPQSTAVMSSPASLPEQWPRFLDNYVVRTQCWFPAIEKFTLYRSANLLSDSTSSAGISDALSPGAIASLWASLALGSLCGTDPSEDSQDTGMRSNSSLALVQMARQLASENCCELDYGHVHAALVLAILELHRQSWKAAWIWTGRAIYVGAILNVLPTGDRPNETHASDASKRLFRACFVLDTLVSSQVGRRPYLNHHDFQCVGDVSVDGMDEWEMCQFKTNPWTREFTRSGPSKTLSAFNDLGRIIALLNSSNYALASGDNPRHSALLREFLRMEIQMPVLNVDDVRPQISLSSLPPNLAQVRIAATVVYVTLHTRAKASDTHMTDATTHPSRGVSDTVKLMQSPEFKSAATMGGFMPPTAAILFGLFERAVLETSTHFPPPAGSGGTFASIFGSLNPPTTEMQSRPGDVQLDPIASSEGGLSTSSNAPLCDNAVPTQPAIAVTQDGAAAPTNVPGDVDLFGQLTLLENADWYVSKSP